MCELTGPMIVACQWNTENDRKQHNYKLVHTSSPTCLIRLDASWFNDGTGLKTDWWSSQSSPTGPAEHWAGGSLWRSVSSCGERKKKIKNTNISCCSIRAFRSFQNLHEWQLGLLYMFSSTTSAFRAKKRSKNRNRKSGGVCTAKNKHHEQMIFRAIHANLVEPHLQRWSKLNHSTSISCEVYTHLPNGLKKLQ